MSLLPSVLEMLLLALAAAMTAIAAATAWASANVIKRLAALFLAQIGAGLAALALGGPAQIALAALAAALASLTIGAAIAVRMQEAYRSIDSDDIDEADHRAEPAD
ncbi:MAG: hypothetical protein AB7L65_03415 [Hyphomonadaceae bacterium]